jgi:ABC-type multidrug transport system ATPase subunit
VNHINREDPSYNGLIKILFDRSTKRFYHYPRKKIKMSSEKDSHPSGWENHDTLPVPQINLREASSSETLHTTEPSANLTADKPQDEEYWKSHETLTLPQTPTTPAPAKNKEWHMTHRVVRNAQRDEAAGFKRRELGVTWKNLSVEVLAAEAAVKENMLSQFNVPQLVKDFRRKPPLKSILSDSHGCIKPGEMLLVLGRPGSGCTTLLKMLANRREGYHSIKGDVRFGNMTSEEALNYHGQIVMNTEEELFYPRLTVGQTMDFATRLKVPFHLPEGAKKEDYNAESMEFLLESMGISHTADTKVGNEFVRGVSGGERKRVSIIECLATNASVYSWDNSTRGLDASTALEWAKALRAMTDVLGLSTIVTLYQAGNAIYNLFDKVLVLDEGKQIYYGPAAGAKPFMEDLGLMYTDGANIGKIYKSSRAPLEINAN